MKILKKLRNYLCYCGIEKEEYNAVKKDAYVSNFEVWRVLHCLMTVAFAFLYVNSLVVGMMASNRPFYLVALIYSAAVTCLFFFVFKKNSIIAQLVIYLSITMLFLFGALVTQNKPDLPATMFMVLLLITPMFMIDKPYFMAIELAAASAVFLVWMYYVKPFDVWKMDLLNIVIYYFVGIFIHVIANSLRIKEFVLTRKINIQKDTDDLTGLNNKGSVTRQINEFLSDETKDKGLMFLLDIDHFKSINDTYGHDMGDSVICQLGTFLKTVFVKDEIVGRFGGDEFIVFIKNTDDKETAKQTAEMIVTGAAEHIVLPDKDKKVSASVGIAVYHGKEKNYSEIFKKADVALYKTKSDRTVKFNIYEEGIE